MLQERFPKSKIIVLHADNSFPAKTEATLHGTESVTVQNFLEKEIPEVDAELIRVIEWRPSLNYYKEAYVKLLSCAVEFIKRTDAVKRTTAAFGKRWFKNFFRNLDNLDQAVLYRATDIPVIITGSGPSLENSLPVIRNIQENCLVIAASSSTMALSHGGISADLLIATDGGGWALRHIYPFLREVKNTKKNTVLAASLCAALPSQCADIPRLILNDGSLWQSIILHELSLPSILIPQRGTVTASAVELALNLSGGSIFLAGTDLCVKDIRSHARPYSFDGLLFNSACRFTPVYSQSFARSSLIQKGGSMDIYAAWFKNQLNSWPKRIFSLSEHTVFDTSLPHGQLAQKNTDNYFKTVSVNNDQGDLRKKGETALLAALKDKRYSSDLKKELVPLLFPNEKEVSEKKMETAIKEILNG